jgi:hypothetical protein
MEPVDRGETSGSGCQVGRPLGGNLVSGVLRPRVFREPMALSSPVRDGRAWFGGRISLSLNPYFGTISTRSRFDRLASSWAVVLHGHAATPSSAFLQLGVEPIGLGPPVLPRHATLEI